LAGADSDAEDATINAAPSRIVRHYHAVHNDCASAQSLPFIALQCGVLSAERLIKLLNDESKTRRLRGRLSAADKGCSLLDLLKTPDAIGRTDPCHQTAAGHGGHPPSVSQSFVAFYTHSIQLTIIIQPPTNGYFEQDYRQ